MASNSQFPAYARLLAAAVATLPILAAAADARLAPAVSGYSGIRLAVPGKMEVIQGDTEAIAIEGAEEDLAKIEAVVEDGVLHIRARERNTRWSSWNPRFRITANAKRVESLGISGSGDIVARSLRTPSLKLAISGSGDIKVPALDTQKTSVSISGSGDVLVGGKTGSLDSHISGSGTVKAEKLDSRQASVSISGSGDAVLWARESLQVKIAGAGDVRYYGDPTVEKRIAGSGSVKRLGLAPS
jgi:hypothetical protein